MYEFPSLFISANCWCNSLCRFCSPGIRSGVMNNFRTYSGLLDDLNLILFFRMEDFSWVELRVNFNRRGLSDFFPRRIAFVIDTWDPR